MGDVEDGEVLFAGEFEREHRMSDPSLMTRKFPSSASLPLNHIAVLRSDFMML